MKCELVHGSSRRCENGTKTCNIRHKNNMKIITPPSEFTGLDSRRLFVGGGISGCPDWQSNLLDSIKELDVVCMNPRREEFDINNQSIADEQIMWEYRHLRKATEILFWFCKETLCPITLYELGAWSMTDKKLFVGVEPGYVRDFDVRFQTKLVRQDVVVVDSLKLLSEQIREYYETNSR